MYNPGQTNGYTEPYQNGANQSGQKKRPEVDVYNTMIKNYASVIKQLTELLPDSKESAKAEAGEALVNFIRQGKPRTKPNGSKLG